MSLLVLLALVAPPAALVLAWRLGRRPARVGHGAGVEWRVASHARRWRLAGIAGGLLAAAASARAAGLGLGLLLAAPLFGLGVLAGVLVGELTAPAPDPGSTRRARVEVRRGRDHLPAGLTGTVGALAGLLVALLAVTTWTADADDAGRAGRSLRQVCPDGVVGSAGPWPGSFYSVPATLAVGAGLAGAATVLHRIARRPRTGTEPGRRADDDAGRRRSATVVVAACGVLVALPLAGTALGAGSALRSLPCPGDGTVAAARALLGTAVVALGVPGWCTAALLAPSAASPALGEVPAP